MLQRLQYLDEVSGTTKKVYTFVLKDFLKNTFGITEKKVDLNGLVDKYFEEKRNVEEDIGNFLVSLKERPPKSQRLYMSIIKTFFVENDVELPEKYWRRTRKRVHGNGKRTDDRPPTNAELKRIINNMPVHGKALFLTMASSGMRIGETLKLELDEIYLNETPVRIKLRGENTKNGDMRTTFISSEAKEQVEEYLKNRDRYLDLSAKRSRFGKDTDDKRLFPWNQPTAQMIWVGAIDKANLNGRDKGTNRYVLHPHVLRQFFRSRMSTKVTEIDLIEEMMGHNGYLTQEYRKHTDEELAKAYSFGESTLMIFGTSMSLEQIEQQVDAKVDNKIESLQKVITNFSIENLELKQRLNQVEFLYNKLEKIIGEKEAEMEIFRAFLEEDKKRKELEEERQKNWEEVRRE